MLKALQWKQEYEIGDYEIDAQHQIFLKLIRKIYKEYSANASSKRLKLLISELYKYVDFHFVSEENFMLKYEYPNYAIHKKEHEQLLCDLSEVLTTFQVEYINFEELILFLLKWFKNHTIQSDMKLGKHLSEIKKNTETDE